MGGTPGQGRASARPTEEDPCQLTGRHDRLYPEPRQEQRMVGNVQRRQRLLEQ
jgi:hypothetical protein